MRSLVAIVLCASVAWAEPPVSNPPPTPESMEFPQAPTGPPVATRGVHKAAFFTCAAGTVALLVFAIVMTSVAQSDAHNSGMSVFTTTADSLSERSQLESLLATGGWIGAALLGVASLLLIPITRWNE